MCVRVCVCVSHTVYVCVRVHRDIAHRNDIPQDLKQEIKHTLQNKIHRSAGMPTHIKPSKAHTPSLALCLCTSGRTRASSVVTCERCLSVRVWVCMCVCHTN